MPQQYWLVLADESLAPDPTPRQLHGYLNTEFLQDDHVAAKPWVLNGWPVRCGPSRAWSWTWVDDRNLPSRDPHELVGERLRLGTLWVRVAAVTRTLDTSFGSLVDRWMRAGGSSKSFTVSTRSLVAMKEKDQRGVRGWATGPTPERLFGVRPRAAGSRNASGGREGGLYDVLSASDEDLGRAVRQVAGDLLPRLRVIVAPGQVRAARCEDPFKEGWEGTFRVELTEPDASACAALGTLLRLTEVVGLGTGTAWGFGSIAAAPERSRPRPSAPGPPVESRRAVRL